MRYAYLRNHAVAGRKYLLTTLGQQLSTSLDGEIDAHEDERGNGGGDSRRGQQSLRQPTPAHERARHANSPP